MSELLCSTRCWSSSTGRSPGSTVEIIEQVEPSYWRLHGSHLPVAVQSPAAGAACTVTVPGAVQWDVRAVSFLYTASGNAATRIPFISFLDQSGTILAKVNTAYTLTASHTSQITFGTDLDQFGANNSVSMGSSIPDLRLLDGLQIQMSADAIDVADTITTVRLYVCQYDVRPDYS
jgi:hypothetical protein